MKPALTTAKQCECRSCGEFFTTDNLFDRHRVGDYATQDKPSTRRCLSPEAMEAKGWRRNGNGFWAGKPMDPAKRASLAVLSAP